MGTTKRRTTATVDDRQQPLWLLVQTETGHGYFHVRCKVTTQRADSERGGYGPYSPDDQYGDGYLWSGLRVTCQGDERSRLQLANGEHRPDAMYAYDCEY